MSAAKRRSSGGDQQSAKKTKFSSQKSPGEIAPQSSKWRSQYDTDPRETEARRTDCAGGLKGEKFLNHVKGCSRCMSWLSKAWQKTSKRGEQGKEAEHRGKHEISDGKR